MNYRHIYHAGNFADVFKHLVFKMVLDYVQQKDKGAFIMDAFAGLGLYSLQSEQAQKTLEYQDGVARLFAGEILNRDLQAFRDFIAGDFSRNLYAGSPLLAAKMLREQDRLVANELHPDDVQDLQHNLRGFDRVAVQNMDAYQALRGALPPKEKRGVVLIDPPFEKKDEFQRLVKQMAEWKKRWATGIYILWYPIKAGQPIDDLYGAAGDLGMNRTWVAEYLLRDRDCADGLNGCGLLILNTPFQIPERVDALAGELTGLMTGSFRSFYLGASISA